MSEQRDRAEEERMKELTKKLNKEKEEALAAQWEECQRLQGEAVEAACSALRKQLRDEFAVEREQAIAEALKTARVSSLHKSLVIKIQSSGLLFSLLFFKFYFFIKKFKDMPMHIIYQSHHNKEYHVFCFWNLRKKCCKLA